MALFRDTINGDIVNAYKCTGDNNDFIKRKLIEDHSYDKNRATEVSLKVHENDFIIVYGCGLYIIEPEKTFMSHCETYTMTPEDENRNDTDRINEIISEINK